MADEIIARESYKDGKNKGVFEYRVGRDAREFPNLPYRIEMRMQRYDGTWTDWDSAYMGHKATKKAALHSFFERHSPKYDLNLDIYDEVVREDFAEKEKNEEEQRQKQKADDQKREADYRANQERTDKLVEQFSGVSFKKQKTKIASPEGKSLPDQEGLSLGGLTITDNGSPPGKWKRYNITHQQSGLLVADEFVSVKDAKVAIWRLTQVMEWDRPQDAVVKDIPEGLKLFTKRMQENPYVDYPDDLKEALKKNGKPLQKKKAEAATETSLQSVHDSRSSRSKESDERQPNVDTIEPDDPRVERWLRDPGSSDVSGIDTPRKHKGKGTGKKVAHKARKSTRTETQVRGIRG